MKKNLIFLILAFISLNAWGNTGNYSQPILKPAQFECKLVPLQNKGNIEACDLRFVGIYSDDYNKESLLLYGALTFVIQNGTPYNRVRTALFKINPQSVKQGGINMEKSNMTPLKINYMTFSSDFKKLIKPDRTANNPKNPNMLLATFTDIENTSFTRSLGNWKLNLSIEGGTNDRIFEIPNIIVFSPEAIEFDNCTLKLLEREIEKAGMTVN